MMSTAIMHQSALYDFGDLFLKVCLIYLFARRYLVLAVYVHIILLICTYPYFQYHSNIVLVLICLLILCVYGLPTTIIIVTTSDIRFCAYWTSLKNVDSSL